MGNLFPVNVRTYSSAIPSIFQGQVKSDTAGWNDLNAGRPQILGYRKPHFFWGGIALGWGTSGTFWIGSHPDSGAFQTLSRHVTPFFSGAAKAPALWAQKIEHVFIVRCYWDEWCIMLLIETSSSWLSYINQQKVHREEVSVVPCPRLRGFR